MNKAMLETTPKIVYGYTRAYYDTYIKLIYLRSRMYSPASGRFTTKDSWQGDYNRPLSLNRWNYVEANPVNYTDPSGEALQSDAEYDECISSQKLNHVIPNVKESVCRVISELEDKNYLTDMPDADHIRAAYRFSADAHKYSTAYHILHDFISIEDLKKTPIDADRNVWYKEEWDVYGCTAQLLGYVDYLVKKNASSLSEDTQLPFRPWNMIYTPFGAVRDVSYALEGYPVGSPKRLPNISLPGISQHVYGQAVDISIGYTEEFTQEGYTEVDVIANKHKLKRPYNQKNYVAYTDDETREWWHFESFGFGR